MLIDGDNYRSSMALFLDNFSKRAMKFASSEVERLEALFKSFLSATSELPGNAFYSQNEKFSASLFESVFSAVCRETYHDGRILVPVIEPGALARLRQDAQFQAASQRQTTNKGNVDMRLQRARAILGTPQAR
jgi:hypothetical protein